MKKLKIISLILFLILGISFLPACWKADSATIKDCYQLYDSVVNKYISSQDLYSNNDSLLRFYPKDSGDEPSIIRSIKFNYSSNESLNQKVINEDVNFIEFSLLGHELQDILDNALYPFYYYKVILMTWNNDIDQALKTSLYNSIENLDESIKTYVNSKNVLETYFDTTNKNFSMEFLKPCINNYFKVINSALNVADSAINCALNAVDFPADDYVIKAEDTTYLVNTILSTANYSTKLIANYYEQYMDFHGLSKLNNTTSSEVEFTNLLNLYSNNYYSNLFLKMKEITQTENGYENYLPNIEYVSSAIKRLNYLNVSANEMVTINEKLGNEIPNAESDYEKYLYYEKYLNVLTLSTVSGLEGSLYFCYKVNN